jgi:uncharacterized protein (DUF427 family)
VSRSTGRGPLSTKRAGRFNKDVPDGLVYVEPFPRRVRGVCEGKDVVASDEVLLVHRPGQPPAYAFPARDVLRIPHEPEPEAAGYVRVAWDVVDEWYEEQERVFMHPRNPYHRVDCVPTARRLRVEAGGLVLVDSTTTIGVYETSLPPRLYVSREQLLADVLRPSPKTTYCPYKGTATYWSADLGGSVEADVAWSYEAPNSECWAIRSHLCFDQSTVAVEEALPAWPGRTQAIDQ